MANETDAVTALSMALRKLARDPRVMGLRSIAEPLAQLDAAMLELLQRQADIAVALLELNAAARYPLSSGRAGNETLRDRLERYAYGSQVPRVHSDD